jgi:hypothetical protein
LAKYRVTAPDGTVYPVADEEGAPGSFLLTTPEGEKHCIRGPAGGTPQAAVQHFHEHQLTLPPGEPLDRDKAVAVRA